MLASPRHDQYWLAWIGLVPLLLTLERRRPGKAFLVSTLCGFAYFSGILIWVYQIPGFKPLHHLLVGAILGPGVGLFGTLFSLLVRRRGLAAAHLLAPFLWVAVEYLRSNIGFLSLPWGLLAHTQYLFTGVIQVASFTGAYGVSFLIVVVNSGLAVLLRPAVVRLRSGDGSSPPSMSPRFRTAWCWTAALLAAASLLYGQFALARPAAEKQVRLAVLQGNIDQERKRDPQKHARSIMQTYIDLTREAVKDDPEIIVWPEAATPGLVLKTQSLHRQIVELARESGKPLVIGSSEYPKFAREASPGGRQGNTALLFDGNGSVRGQYLKIHLVPFGEFLPLEGSFTWPAFVVNGDGRNWDLPGKEHTVFRLGPRAFGAVICWEQVFPELFRTFVRAGARFMLNMTNEGWFGDSDAPYQMLAISVFRAVENGVPLARAANTGISCFIDRRGRIDGMVAVGRKPTFVSGHLTRTLSYTDETTFYTRHGDLFALAALAVAAAATLWLLIPRRRHGAEEAETR